MSYNVLSLDGGGSWALIEVLTLIDLYGASTRGNDVLQNFDLVAANSGGSLVLAGLVEDKRLDEILSMFRDERLRRTIFSPTHHVFDRVLEYLLHLGPKYSAAGKLPAIERLLPRTGDHRMKGITAGLTGPGGQEVRLLIVAFEYDRERAVFFRSAPSGGPDWGNGASASVTLAAAVHASTDAPLQYFDGPAKCPGSSDRYWDGGVTGCNNPILAAVTEAATLGVELHDIAALSLGSGTVRLALAPNGSPSSPFLRQRSKTGLVSDLKKLTASILDDPPDAATFIAHAMTGGKKDLPSGVESRITRMNPVIRPIRASDREWAAPDGWTAAEFDELCQIGMDAIEQREIDAIGRYAETWMRGGPFNQPIRSDGESLEAEIGYDTYRDAKMAWQRIQPLVMA